MPLPLKRIHELELQEQYPEAIDALEERLRHDPSEFETVIRLGFNLWYAVSEAPRLKRALPVEMYARRFMELLREYQSRMENVADFCWAFGLGLSLFWFEFPGADEAQGELMLQKAKDLDPFYRSLDQEEMCERFRGRGIMAAYYAVA